ncbi:MAG: hypothetical protein JXM72_06950, partial [Deltaproteobacteria bacterium]|nr:hypothetical protein [Deltaproteobacteria bacterium]
CITSEELRRLGRKAATIAACFCPRTIYADLGDFSSVSNEATLAHIRSAVDKTGLFNENYFISFKKIYDIDTVRGKFSYLAIPASDINRIDIFDENETFLEIYCPIEAAIASVVARKTGETVITIFEDHRHVRIIGSKQGVIYYLITINKQESFDLPAETVSGVHEMISLLRNSYNETHGHLFIIGEHELSRADLEENDVHAEPFEIEGILSATSSNVELVGNVLAAEYDFTPERFRKTKQLALYSKYSICVSALIILISFFFLFLGVRNTHTAQIFENRSFEAQEAYLKNLSTLEKDYKELCTELDFSNINSIISMYKDFETEPKLYTILGTITEMVPEHVSITRITVARPGVDMNMTSQGTPESNQQKYSTHENILSVKIEGIIKSQYPQSKNTFATYLAYMQDRYSVNHATFAHTQESASFTVECETRQ